ncbi:MAG TPA: NlpC/P60 family protein [Streptosporangiaceae bacterium]|nr:NlpC/P60 family protein [Streptosporangiaceae bacterium]
MRTIRRVAPLAATAVAVALLLQPGASDAQTTLPQPSLAALVAEAKQLSNQVDSLSQQYDGLQIQIANAKTQERLAKLAAARAQRAMAGSQLAVSQLAAMGYMNQGYDPTLQMMTSGDPTLFLNQASTVLEINNQAGLRLTNLQKMQIASQRAQATAKEEIATVNQLQGQINGKVKAIQSKLDILNSSAMAQAMAIFDQTGSYPNVVLPLATNVGTTALRAALTQRGKPYLWGAAGPDAYDCSGLVVWAFAQEGISLPHYTGSLWNSGMHVSRDQLEPGDLVFFFADISHVGIYLGNGLMVDAPSAGQDVQVQAVFWDAYVGAVRIA